MPLRAAIAVLCLSVLSVAPLHAQSGVIELNEAGWKALQNGNGDRAAVLFGEALTLRPNDPVLLFGAGAAANAQGKRREAMARLGQALEREPHLTAASRLLGEIAYREGETALAIRTYEKALKYAPKETGLATEVETWRQDADVHRGFEERRYDRFRVMFEGRAEESLAAQATTVLNSAFWRIGETLGEYPSESVVAVLYTEKQFRDITRAPEWSDGQYDGRIRIPVAGASQEPELFRRVLTHELTHAMIASVVPGGVPTWLNEGLAQHFEGSDPEAARRRMKTAGRSIPLKNLERGFLSMNAADAQVAYDESLLAVSLMFARPGFGWGRLLQAVSDGSSFEHTINSFGFSYADLEAGFSSR